MRIVVGVRDLTRSAVDRVRRARPVTILAAGWLAFLVYAYPGLMTQDSFDQLAEGRAHAYSDPHPPAMAALWGQLDRIIAGPVTILVLQSVMLLAGLYLVLRRALSPRRAALFAVLVLLFPPVLSPMAVIWKDCLMAGGLMLGTGLLFDERRGAQLAGLVCLGFATAVRYNAPAATLPIVVLLFRWPGITRPLARYALAAAAWAGITAAAFGIDAALVDYPMYAWQSSNAVMDIAGTLSYADADIPDAELRPILAGTQIHVDHDIQAALRAVYTPRNYAPLIMGPHRLWDLPMWGHTPAPAAQRDAVTRAWWQVVTAHPGAYVRERLATFAEVLGLGRDHVPGMVVTEHNVPAPFAAAAQVSTRRSALAHRLVRANAKLAWHTPLFRPYIYLFLLLVLLVVCRWRDSLALIASGLLMELSLLPFAPSPDYRYSHWMITCACIVLVTTIARRSRLPSTRRAPAPAAAVPAA